MSNLKIETPRWAVPLLKKSRYKGAKGGRNGGKSHFFAELAIERSLINPDTEVLCVREIQKSLKYSAKKLIEDKIRKLNLVHLFDIQNDVIYRMHKGQRRGLFVFVGMQDHTADSVKSFEGFDIAWVEEAQSLSARSIKLLTPTIRKEGSEIWFGWNPYLASDAVDTFFRKIAGHKNSRGEDVGTLVTVNYIDNPYLTEDQLKEAEMAKQADYNDYLNVWMGHYATRTDDQVFGGKWEEGILEPDLRTWDGPYHGIDFGFAKDPLAVVKVWVTNKDELYIEKECGKVGLELDDTPSFVKSHIEGICEYVIRADSARPEAISFLRRRGLGGITSVDKWSGSLKDGIDRMKAFRKIIVHPDCAEVKAEMTNYKYKTDKRSGDILPDIVDKDNHYIDAIRYAICPLIKDDGTFTDYDSIL